MSGVPGRSQTNPSMPAVPDPTGFAQGPVTSPGMQPFINQSVQPQPQSSGLSIPLWLVQLVPLLTVIAGAIMLFAVQRADVQMLKDQVAELKAGQQAYVSRQVFDIKSTETENTVDAINRRLDRIETLLSGIYDRLPAKPK